jgi:hypothetical protein
MTEEQLNIEISLLINKTLYEQETINYQEYLLAEEILLNKLNNLS